MKNRDDAIHAIKLILVIIILFSTVIGIFVALFDSEETHTSVIGASTTSVSSP